MPVKVEALITAETDTSNSVSGVVANLATLLEADEDVDVACLCNDSVRQIYRVEGEGNHFCGYRNMQMLLSVLTSSGDVPSTISDKILERRPTIPELQTAIEAAWDAGYNSHGKVLTGGIQGTRKHVGTPEAEALILSLDLQCTGHAFHGKEAWTELLDSVESFFTANVGRNRSNSQKVLQTNRSPIFLQRPNHSITIVGIERMMSGKRRLLVFDPAWHPPAMMANSLEASLLPRWRRNYLLSRYRKGRRYLSRFRDFETLRVDEIVASTTS